MVKVLDPTVGLGVDDADPGPELPSLRGKNIGFRIDILWRSWDWTADEWAKLMKDDGANVTIWRALGRTGDEGDRTMLELDAFLAEQDAAVVGLGNCGSCTSWTIHDALSAANRGLPTVAVATAHFEQLARTLATRGGRSGLRLEVLPYPYDTLPEDEVRDIARSRYRSLLRTLGVRA